MKTFRIGKYHVMHIEKMLTPGFAPVFLFPDFDSGIPEEHQLLSSPRFWNESSRKVMSSTHLTRKTV